MIDFLGGLFCDSGCNGGCDFILNMLTGRGFDGRPASSDICSHEDPFLALLKKFSFPPFLFYYGSLQTKYFFSFFLGDALRTAGRSSLATYSGDYIKIDVSSSLRFLNSRLESSSSTTICATGFSSSTLIDAARASGS